MTWHPGDRALCIDTAPMPVNGHTAIGGNAVELGKFYTVERVFVRDDDPWAGIHCLTLEGVDYPTGIASSRFRKVGSGEVEPVRELVTA